MAFRVVVIKKRCKLEYSMNYLICRDENETRILIDEISTLIIQSTEVAITTALLSNLASKNVKVIFCDAKHNPQSQLLPLYGTSDSFKKIQIQIGWEQDDKDLMWQEIIKKKIYYQMINLKNINNDCHNKLLNYLNEVEKGDISNREGHAAKVYFNALFGADFSRRVSNDINKYLDYGYSIILSSINREIKMFGYLTELGIHHIGETNPYNLSCDLIEPLRPLVDMLVITNVVNEENFKREFINLLNKNVLFQNKNMFLENAIKLYVQNMLMQLKNKTAEYSFIEYEL